MFVCDRESYIEDFNRAAVDLWGREPRRRAEKHCGSLRIFLPDGTPLPHEQTPLQQVLQTGMPVRDVEVAIERPDGKRLPVLVNFEALHDEAGHISGAITSFHDISSRKRAERQLREADARYRTLFDSIDEGFCVLEMVFDERCEPVDWRFLETNPAFESQSGLPGAIGKRIRELAPGIEQHWLRSYGQVALTGEPIRYSAPSQAVPGWFDVYAFRLGGPGSRQVAVIFRNIAGLKNAEGELRRTLDELESRVAARTADLEASNRHLRAEIGQRKKIEETRRHLLDRLLNAEEDERRRISRELHDQVGQQLTAVMLGLKSLQPALPPSGRETIGELEAMVENISKEVHDLALALRSTALKDVGLAPALASYLENWSARTKVKAEFRGAALDRRLPSRLETTVYRLVQEALTNIAKHARGKHVSVVLERRVDHLLLIVEDDGIGFDVDATLNARPPRRFGLLGMKERAGTCGGTVTFESFPARGTTIYGHFPLSDSEAVHA